MYNLLFTQHFKTTGIQCIVNIKKLRLFHFQCGQMCFIWQQPDWSLNVTLIWANNEDVFFASFSRKKSLLLCTYYSSRLIQPTVPVVGCLGFPGPHQLISSIQPSVYGMIHHKRGSSHTQVSPSSQ